jgi:signal transduction histidine kinase
MSGVLAAKRRRIPLLGLAVLLVLFARGTRAAEADPPPWRVLILYSSGLDIPGITAELDGFRSALTEAAAPRRVSLRSETVDLMGPGPVTYEPELLRLLEKKYRDEHFDLVMAMGVPTLAFAEHHAKELWPDAPIVFFSIGLRGGQTKGPHTTGVTLDWDEAGTLDLARRLQPRARQLVLVAGNSAYDRGFWPRLEAAAQTRGQGMEVESLLGQPLPVTLERLTRLSPDAIVLYGSITLDAAGQPLSPWLGAEQIARVSAAPVYAIMEGQVGSGVVGGSMESFADHGRRAAAVAVRVLRGTPPADIPVAPPANPVPIVDWRQLQRFGLSEADLPPGSVVRYRPPSFLDEHRGVVIGGGLALAVQTGLILALLVQAGRRRRAEAEATRQRAELAHAARLSAVGELTASVAHEINQPLGAILSNAEAAELFLDSNPPQLERVREILHDIQQENHRASAVIREVRALARKQTRESGPLDLNETVREVMPLLEGDARRRRVGLDTGLAPGLPLVNGDGAQLRLLVLNLVLNGLDAVGQIPSGPRLVRIRTRLTDGHVELTVSDTGPGLAQEDLPRLFESFFTTKPDGLGLGLSIVRSIVQAHGGHVSAENNAVGGASFRVRLPALLRGSPGRKEG